MKPAKPGSVPKTVDEYLAGVSEPARSTLNKIRAVIRSAVPPETTEVISYRMPVFKHKGLLIGFAAFSDHCSLFPMGSSALLGLEDQLKAYSRSKGTIRFPLDRPLPTALVKKIVKARLAQNEQKKSR